MELEKEDDYRGNAEKLWKTIHEHLDIQTLTPFILNKLLKRIEVGHTEMMDEQPRQENTNVRRFCGELR